MRPGAGPPRPDAAPGAAVPGVDGGPYSGVMTRYSTLRSACLALTLSAAAGSPSGAQLRPLEPIQWRAVGYEGHSVLLGGSILAGQRASLAGTKGRLLELGAFRGTWRTGRVAMELAGTAVWLFDEQSVFAEPVDGVIPAEDARRTTTGDYRVSTVVQLFAPGADRQVALRFGVRLPTTDNLQGLDRDQTDFFSTVAGRVRHGPWEFSGELGIGINGTRDLHNEQVDPLLFGFSAHVDAGPARGTLELYGQHDTRAGRDRRGTEDLGEGRVGVEVGGERWLSVALVRGWTPASPDLGLIVMLGTHF